MLKNRVVPTENIGRVCVPEPKSSREGAWIAGLGFPINGPAHAHNEIGPRGRDLRTKDRVPLIEYHSRHQNLIG